MENKRWNEVVEEFVGKMKETLLVKEEEYSPNSDRLSFFKYGAEMCHESPEKILKNCLDKHMISYSMMMDDMIKNGTKYTKQKWFDKLGDMANYFVLLYALMEDDNMYKGTVTVDTADVAAFTYDKTDAEKFLAALNASDTAAKQKKARKK